VLFQGFLGPIRWVRRAVPLLLLCAAGDLLLTPLETPVRLVMTSFKLHPLLTLLPFCSSLLLIAGLSLTRQLLSSTLAREELKTCDGKGWKLAALTLGLLLLAAKGAITTGYNIIQPARPPWHQPDSNMAITSSITFLPCRLPDSHPIPKWPSMMTRAFSICALAPSDIPGNDRK